MSNSVTVETAARPLKLDAVAADGNEVAESTSVPTESRAGAQTPPAVVEEEEEEEEEDEEGEDGGNREAKDDTKMTTTKMMMVRICDTSWSLDWTMSGV